MATDKISFKALLKYESLFPGKSGFDLLTNKNLSTFTDLQHRAFVIKYTKDPSVSLASIEDLSFEDLTAVLKTLAVPTDGEAK